MPWSRVKRKSCYICWINIPANVPNGSVCKIFITAIDYPMAVHPRFISLLLGYVHKIYITAGIPNDSIFFYSVPNVLVPKAVGSMYSMVVHLISVPVTAYSTDPYPRHYEVRSF